MSDQQMSESHDVEGYCDECSNLGIINCLCGGDLCVCGDPEPPCECCIDGFPCGCYNQERIDKK